VATLAASGNPTQIGFQIGGGGTGDVYLDNLRVQAIPEPGTLALLALGALGLLGLRGRR
jgi:hypothetical protein